MKKEIDEAAGTRVYPLTILRDRYGGAYSESAWTAWNLEAESIPEDVHSDDVSCASFWYEHDFIVGFGATPNDACMDLAEKLKATK